MSKPELADYGLKGIDSRPDIDVDLAPVSDEEYERALKHIIEWQVGNFRAARFRADLLEWELQERGL